MRHGYAVAIGMVYASRLAQRTGLCDASVPERVEKLIKSYGLPDGPFSPRPQAVRDRAHGHHADRQKSRRRAR